MPLYFSFYVVGIFFFILSNDRIFKIVGNKIIFFLCFLCLLCFAGFRYGIATDYWSYHEIFNGRGQYARIEPGFKFLIKLYKIFFNSRSYNGFIFFIALLSIGLKSLYFNRLKYPFLALVLYIGLYYIHLEYNGIRQALAVALIYFGIHYAVKRKTLPFLVFISLATIIHLSSVLFFPFYFLCIRQIGIKRHTIILLIIFTFLIRLFILDIILGKILSLLAGSTSIVMNQIKGYLFSDNLRITAGFIRRLAVLAVFLMVDDEKYIKNCFLFLFLAGFLLYILFMGNDIAAFRISLCFDVFMIPLFGNMNIRFSCKNIVIFTVFLTVVFATYMAQFLTGYALPYQTFLPL